LIKWQSDHYYDKQGGNLKIALISSLLVFIAISADYCRADEIIHPANNDIQIEYALSSTNLTVGDTLIITRLLVNNSADTLGNLYWTDNLPPGMNILAYSISVNGAAISNYYSGPLKNSLYNSYNSFRWVIDLPAEEDPYNHKINLSDSVAIIYSVICPDQGSFVLPFHTACFHNGDHGSYTIGEPIAVDVSYNSGTGGIAGTVTDHNQNPIPSAEITVNETGAISYSTGYGLYSFMNLEPGVYSLSIEHPEYNDASETDIQVYAGQTTIRDIILYSPDLLYIPGDINGDGTVIGSDVTYAVNYFRGAGSPPPDSVWLESSQSWLYAAGDANGSCSFIGADVTYLVNYFRGIFEEILFCPEAPPQ